MAVKVAGALSDYYYRVADDVVRIVETPAWPAKTSEERDTPDADETNR